MYSPPLCSPKKETGASEEATTQAILKLSPEGSRVVISPAYLDFQDKPMSIPAVEVVRIFNNDERSGKEREELAIHAVTSDSPSFYTSFYRPITIAPGKDFAMDVAFLPRAVSGVESSISIYTSAGTFVLTVSGRGIPNPYKVQPFVGVKVPLGEIYEPSIELYNPHYEVLTIREIYTSSNALNLQLPTNSLNYTSEKCGEACENSAGDAKDGERRLKLWEIAPHARRTLIKLRFAAQKTGKFQGFVNIKTSKANLIVHVDVSVVSGAVHRTPEELDFGVLTLQDTKTLNLTILNSGATFLHATDLHMAGTSDPNLEFAFLPTLLPPKRDVAIASLTYTARSEGTFKGKLLLRTNDTNPVFARLEVSYRVRVLSGYVSYPTAQTHFASFDSKLTSNGDLVKIDTLDPVVQDITLTNKFSVPIVLFNAEIDDTQLRVVDFTPSQIAEPGESWTPLKIEFRPKTSYLLFTTHLHLVTNASLVSIPLHICHGKLTYKLPDEAHQYSVGPLAAPSESASSDSGSTPPSNAVVHVNKHPFDVQALSVAFGTVPVNEVQTRTLNVTNHNPLKLPLLGIWSDVEGLSVKLESVWNAQGYRSVSHISFTAHVPTTFEVKNSESATQASEGSKTPSSSQSKPSDRKKQSSKRSSADPVTNLSNSKDASVFNLPPGHSALFSLELRSTRDAVAQGFVYFSTPHERSAIAVSYTSFAGNLELSPERFVFDTHLRQSIPLSIRHTYSRSIQVTSITSNDARLQVNLPKSNASSSSSIGSQDDRHKWLRPNTDVKLGSVSFLPLLAMKSTSEPPIIRDSPVALPVSGEYLSEPEAVKMFAGLDSSPQKRHNDIRVTLTVNTDLKSVHSFPVRVQRWQPTVIAHTNVNLNKLENNIIDFGLTETGVGVQERKIAIANPLLYTHIAVQLQFSDEALLETAVEDEGKSETSDGSTKGSTSCFKDFGFAKSALVFSTLMPGETKEFGPIVYKPNHDGPCTSRLYIRSNLTTIETIVVKGNGGGGYLTFSRSTSKNIAPDTNDMKARGAHGNDLLASQQTAVETIDRLVFAIDDSALEPCQEPENSEDTTSLNSENTDGVNIKSNGKSSSENGKAGEVNSRDSASKKSVNIVSGDESTKKVEWSPPVHTQTIVVQNDGNLHLFLQSAYFEPTSAGTASKRSTSWSRSQPSPQELGGFSLDKDTAKQVISEGLAPGASARITLSFTPDFTTTHAQYDLVLRSNGSKEFRFPLVGEISEKSRAACSAKYPSPHTSSLATSSLKIPLIASAVVIVAVAAFLWDKRRRNSVSLEESSDLPTNKTPAARNGSADAQELGKTTGSTKNGASETSKSKAKSSAEDLENHATPICASVNSPASNTAATNVSSSGTTSTQNTTSTSSKDKKKDKKEKQLDAKANKAQSPASQAVASKASDGNKPESTSSTAVAPIDNDKISPSTSNSPGTKSLKGENSGNSEANPTSTSSAPTTASTAPSLPPTGSKKKDKKEKKEIWQSKPIEPVFGPLPTSPTSPSAASASSPTVSAPPAEEVTTPPRQTDVPQISAQSDDTQPRKSKKSSSAEAQTTSEASPVSTTASSRTLSPNSTSPTSTSPDSTSPEPVAVPSDANRVSPQPIQQRQTLVPAKRPSSKPLPKYARKDGLGKDAPPQNTAPTTSTSTANTTATPAQSVGSSTNAAAPFVGHSGPVLNAPIPIRPIKDGKKGRQTKEYKQKQSQNTVPQTLDVALLPSSESPRIPSSLLLDPSLDDSNPLLPHHARWLSGSSDGSSSPPGFGPAGYLHAHQGVPTFPGGALAQLHEYSNLSGGAMNPFNGSSAYGTGPHGTPANALSLNAPSSPATFMNPLLLSPSSLSASRYDYGRRGLTSSGGMSGGANGGTGSPVNFDFSNAPTFDHLGIGRTISRENSATPPASATPPMMRWYNPMAPGNGSVENLLAALRDPDAPASESGSSTPRGEMNVFFGSGSGTFTPSGSAGDLTLHYGSAHHHHHPSASSPVDWSSTGPLPAVGAGGVPVWSGPTTESAVEENVSNLSMLGLIPRNANASHASHHHHHPHPFSTVPGGSPRDAHLRNNSPFYLGLHNIVHDPSHGSPPASPLVPPGLDYLPRGVTSSSTGSPPAFSPAQLPPNSPFSHLSFFTGEDPEFFGD